jgi:hypothetical protein
MFGLSKRQEALQKAEESRKKAEGKTQEAQMQIFSLCISPSPDPGLNPSLSAFPSSFKNRQGLSTSRRARGCKPKAKEPTLKNCIGE